MNDLSFEFNQQLALDVLLNGLSEITSDYIMETEYDKFTEVIIPEGVKRIGMYTFSGASSLTSITIPTSVTDIREGAFGSCWKLTNIVISNGVRSIGDCAFIWCDSLTSITIPESVKNIGVCAFWNCNNLNNLIFEGKTLEEVRSMENYPWSLSPEKISVQVS